MPRSSVVAFAAPCILAAAFASPLNAQTGADTLHRSDRAAHQVSWTYGTSAGALHFGDGGHERAISAVLSAELLPGLTVNVNPTYAWAQAAPTANATTGALVTPAPVHGLADLPVGVSWSHALPGAFSPGVSVGLGATLPVGDTMAVGSGQTSVGANLGLSVAPAEGWWVGAGAGHSLANDWASSLGAIAPTSVWLGASREFGRIGVSGGYSTEVGAMPIGTTHSQNFSAGATVPLGSGLSLALNGSTGRADGASSWAVSAGLGTTFAEVAQVSPFAAMQALTNTFGAGRGQGKSRSVAAKAAQKSGGTAGKGKKP